MMPYVRGYVSIAAGILNLPYKVFVPLVAVSALLWSGGYVTLGHFLGRNWETVARTIEQYKWSFLVFIISIIGIWFFVKHRKKVKDLVK
jgi:membrane protein DedA with SNARE-associated domain